MTSKKNKKGIRNDDPPSFEAYSVQRSGSNVMLRAVKGK
jgi:hypothetical protein